MEPLDRSYINDTGKIPKNIALHDDQAYLPEVEQTEFLLITGMSGAGRSRVADTLEDLDWYVVDNMPPSLIQPLRKIITDTSGIAKFAAVVDVRSRSFFDELSSVMASLRETNSHFRMLFLDCSDEELVKRFENVRRPHPLQGQGRLLDGIRAEREILTSLRDQADIVIDTSRLSVHDLARKVRRSIVGEGDNLEAPRITVMSFGFKYGVPVDADNMVDVRFLANPYWVSELRHLTGHDSEVADFVLSLPGAQEFVNKYCSLMMDVMNGYAHELKPFLTIAVGCTGGKHRSVAIAEAIAENLRNNSLGVRVVHRDLGRE
ncbi:MAG: RNase adapter RapZ [Actinomycetaceae bacterium]|nr:RNase adapter RapZ [Actinomycetaceae bacterium]